MKKLLFFVISLFMFITLQADGISEEDLLIAGGKHKDSLIGSTYVVAEDCNSIPPNFFASIDDFIKAVNSGYDSYNGLIKRYWINPGDKLKVVNKKYVGNIGKTKIYLYKIYSYSHKMYLYNAENDFKYYLKMECYILSK